MEGRTNQGAIWSPDTDFSESDQRIVNRPQQCEQLATPVSRYPEEGKLSGREL